MKKETIGFAIGLLLLFVGYFAAQSFYLQKQLTAIDKQETQVSLATKAQTPPPPRPPQSTTSSAFHPEAQNPSLEPLVAEPQNLRLSSTNAVFNFTPVGGCLGENSLLHEQVAYDDPTPVAIANSDALCKAFGFRVGEQDLRMAPAGISRTPEGGIRIVQRTSNLEIIRTFQFPANNYMGDFNLTIRNISNSPFNQSVDFEIGATSDEKTSGGLFSMHLAQFHGVAIRLGNDSTIRESTPFEDSPTQKVILQQSGVTPTWLSVDSLYWMNTLIPQFSTPLTFEVLRTGYNLKKSPEAPINQTVYEAWIKTDVQLAPGESKTYPYKLYFGPKSESILSHFSQYHLNETIDYGFFRIIARPLYQVLNFIHSLVGNWGVSIILLTIVINLIFLPLQLMGYSSAQKMQMIQPKIKALQEKYKNEKQLLQRETMALMSKNGVNPLGGCLPLLPQIPVFFGLDSTLRHTFDLRQAPFYFWIRDLTQHDPYFVLPILMAILMIGYQKMIPMPSMDPAQAKMMKFLPILFSVFMVFYPSGLALYVITNTVVSMIRQFFLTRRRNAQIIL